MVKIDLIKHADFMAALASSIRKQVAAEIADWIADMPEEEYKQLSNLDLYEAIIDKYDCSDFLEQVEY